MAGERGVAQKTCSEILDDLHRLQTQASTALSRDKRQDIERKLNELRESYEAAQANTTDQDTIQEAQQLADEFDTITDEIETRLRT